MATHSSILAWRIPWTEEPDGLQSLGLQESDTTERLNHHDQHHHQGLDGVFGSRERGLSQSSGPVGAHHHTRDKDTKTNSYNIMGCILVQITNSQCMMRDLWVSQDTSVDLQSPNASYHETNMVFAFSPSFSCECEMEFHSCKVTCKVTTDHRSKQNNPVGFTCKVTTDHRSKQNNPVCKLIFLLFFVINPPFLLMGLLFFIITFYWSIYCVIFC